HQVAKLLIEPSATRDRLTAGMHISLSEDNPVGVIELAMVAAIAAEPIEAKIRDATREGRVSTPAGEDRVSSACAAGIISTEDVALLRRAKRLADLVIRVDDFPPDLGASEIRSAGGTIAHRAAA